MSTLRNRIVNHAGVGHELAVVAGLTDATPMLMPLAHVQYDDNEQALYGTLHPLYTADGAVVPAHSPAYVAEPVPAPVVPAGRP